MEGKRERNRALMSGARTMPGAECAWRRILARIRLRATFRYGEVDSEGRRAVTRVEDTTTSEGDDEMGKVTTGGTMSLDGYIAGPEESGFDLLFQWYGNGDVEIPSASPDVPPPRISAASAALIKPEWENTGALVVGRHLYDMTNAWG